jgi:hypothetical protein
MVAFLVLIWKYFLLGSKKHESKYLRNMKIHILITLTTSAMLHKSRATALDLDTTSSLVLNMFHIGSSMTHNLSTKVETRKWFKINEDLLLGPFTLFSH